MNARIVPTGTQHVEGFHAVIDSVAREERYLAMLEAPPLDEVRQWVADTVAKRRPHFVALMAGKVVGWCDVFEKPRPALEHSGVLGIGVLEPHRGRGIGRALLQHALDDARTKGFTRVELTVRVDNERAKQLYEKLGFEVEGLCRHHMRVRGAYYDSWLMAWLA